MNSPSDPTSTDSKNRLRQLRVLQGSAGQNVTEQTAQNGELKPLDKSEPIADAPGSISNEQLREIAGKHQLPATWFEQQEENLF